MNTSGFLATVRLVGKLRFDCPACGPNGLGQAMLDWGGGRIKVMSTARDKVDKLTGIAQDSIVEVAGDLRHHRWTTGGAAPRELFEVEIQRIHVLEDSRKKRLFR